MTGRRREPRSVADRDGRPSRGDVSDHPVLPSWRHAVTVKVSGLADHLAEELRRRWRGGERPPAEELLNRHPELWQQPGAAADLIYEEVCLRQELGELVDADTVLARFPQWRAQLEVLLDCHRLLEPGRAEPRFPEVGEALGDYRLLAELGRGAQGRVFLAAHTALADRPVVLKLTPRTGQEHLTLARLQHTHIVPLYSMHDVPECNLRVLCMPYFGGASLAQLLHALRARPPAERSGQHLLDALDRSQRAAPVSLPCTGPGRRFLAGATFVEAVCGIGACLADALHYAHERGLLHLDLKPANVLLAADGQPLLLDFHLARPPVRPGSPPAGWVGGTLAYMPREQQAALAAISQGRPIPAAVDARADLYALGAVLYEALGGPHPYLPRVSPPLHRCNPRVSLGLSDLIEKCLAYEAGDRYPDAAAVAADLRRHLAHQPLRGVPNRSWHERWQRLRRRHRHRLSKAVLFLAVLLAAAAVGLGGGAYLVQQWNGARAALAEGKDLLREGSDAEAEHTLRRGLAWAEDLPGAGSLREELTSQLRLAEQARMAAERARARQELRALVDRMRWLYGADLTPSPALRKTEADCRSLWDRRQALNDLLAAESDPGARERLRTDLLDLAVLECDLCVRLAGADAAAARQEALRVLAQAEELLGPGPVLRQERRAQAAALGRPELAPGGEDSDPRTAWEHTALGRSFLRAGDYQRAAVYLEQALRLEPQGLWPNYYQGLCLHHFGRYQEAVVAFSVCLGAAPESAACFCNRALAYTELGRSAEAVADYDQALRLDAGCGMAALNRGVLHYRAGRYGDARADLERALATGADPAVVNYNLALVHLAQGERDAALASLERALECDPGHGPAQALREQLLRRGEGKPRSS